MKFFGRMMKERFVILETVVEDLEKQKPLVDRLEHCLRAVCKEFDISVPIWLDRNTSEFACFRRTTFTPEQFIDQVKFDKLQIEVVLDK
ncbi:MAG: hypothetical protein WCL54_08630 [Clostridia bacterium]